MHAQFTTLCALAQDLKVVSSAQNKSHRHVIHVCTYAFLLLSLYTFNTHIFFLDPFIKNNLSGHVADQQTLRYSAKKGVWPFGQNYISHWL